MAFFCSNRREEPLVQFSLFLRGQGRANAPLPHCSSERSISKDLTEKGLIGKVKGRPGKEEDCREEAV